jgi:hypothetical protein
MIGIWSAYASTFLILLAVISAVFLSIPIFIAPLRWARILGWPIPAQTDLAVYFGRCLGAVRGTQPVAETIEIAIWAGLALLILACWPVT